MDVKKLLTEDLGKWGDREFIFEKKEGKYQSITFSEFTDRVYALSEYLIDKGFKDKTILMLGKNSTGLMEADLAVTAFVGRSMIISKCSDTVAAMIKSAGISAIIYSEETYAYIEDIDVFKMPVEEIAKLPSASAPEKIDTKDENECAKIVFSSGTTSAPKGVMLSLKNIFFGAEALRRRTGIGPEDSTYLFLPLSHTYGDIYNFYCALVLGFKIYLASSTDNIAAELLEVNPTIFCAVPLVYQRLLDAYKDHISMAFGKNIKFLFCGGADCTPEMRRAYSGFNFLQAYALSETASSFAIDYPDDRDDYSAGTIFENIDVKIADEKDGIGEIIVKGDNVFLGYTDPKLTAEVMDENGYLHTGDLGYLKGNKLYVTGRKKKILVASNGQNIDIAEITELLKSKSDNIVKVHFSLDGNLLNAVIYVSDTSKDVKDAVEEFNKEVPGNERIINYEVRQHVIGNK